MSNFLNVLIIVSFASSAARFLSICPSYCNTAGYYKQGFYCSDPTTPVFCCGNETFRQCCHNHRESIGDNVPPRYECPKSSFWLFNWQIFVGTLTGLILICLLAACCYFTCEQIKGDRGPISRRLRRNQGERRRTSIAALDVEFQNMPPPALDPVTGNIIPPAYDTLPKDPPTYAETMGLAVPPSTTDNATAPVPSTSNSDALRNETVTATSAPPIGHSLPVAVAGPSTVETNPTIPVVQTNVINIPGSVEETINTNPQTNSSADCTITPTAAHAVITSSSLTTSADQHQIANDSSPSQSSTAVISQSGNGFTEVRNNDVPTTPNACGVASTSNNGAAAVYDNPTFVSSSNDLSSVNNNKENVQTSRT